MKNQLKKNITLLILCLTMGTIACGCGKSNKEEVTITLMNGEEKLGTLTVGAGEKVKDYEKYESLDGYEFLGWFETPTFIASSKKDLSSDTFKENKTLYGSFKNTNVTEDKRPWTIVGTGKGDALTLSSWNNACDDKLVSFVATGKNPNEFTLTLDLFNGDQFQIIHDYDWTDQRGYGWFKDLDATMFENGGGLSGDDKSSNVNVLKDGNYTITIVTDPDNSALDSFTIVRNGDAVGKATEKETPKLTITDTTQVLIKGSWVSDWSENKELTRKEGTNTYSITMELAAGTEVYFMVWNDGKDTEIGLKGENVKDADSNALLEGGYNVKVKDAGNYTFTVDLDAFTISVAK